MDDKSFTVRVPKRWARIALIVGVTALIVAPLTAWAAHSFDDVPNDNTFHEEIEWLRQSGVTIGCNPPDNTLFCPDDNVTREQMAAFMERFADYMGAIDGTPAQADNASTLGGDAKGTFHQFGGTLPQGQSLSGTYAISGDAGFPADGINFSIPLPGDIPTSDAHFLGEGVAFTANCPGPGQAAPGHLCVYEADQNGSPGFQCFCDPTSGGQLVQEYGTNLFMSTAVASSWSHGSWTVTSSTSLTQLSTAQSGGDPATPGG